MRKAVQRVMNRYSRWRIDRTLPGVVDDLADYARKSKTTGTQWITLWMAVRSILRNRPIEILESGTGSSTLVLAAAVRKLRSEHPGYEGRITSMESVEPWYDVARQNLPAKYSDVVEIVLGPREKFEMGFFRGYVHSGIPKRDYSFVLLDAPDYRDEHGLAFCADVFKIMDVSNAREIHGVVDGRASSVFVLQTLFGVGTARYYHGLYAAHFTIPRIDFRDPENKTPKDWRCTALGRLIFMKFRR